MPSTLTSFKGENLIRVEQRQKNHCSGLAYEEKQFELFINSLVKIIKKYAIKFI